jgi:hypothetical protein
VFFPISYTSKHVISYKCKYVLFHLNMLRLCQEINKGANMSMQKVSMYSRFLHLVCQNNYISISLFLFCCFLEFFVIPISYTCKHVV